MKKTVVIAVCLLLACASAVISGGRSTDPLGVAVSPQTLLLGSDQGGHVVVHTDGLPYSAVVGASVTLNGVPARSVGADTCGDLVAYFDEAEIKAIVAVPKARLTLAGLKVDGTAFAGSDTVRVVKK